MKIPRTDKVAIVVGRNKRVYARVYKMEKSVFDFAQRYLSKEAEKSREEGFLPTGTVFNKLDDTTYKFTIEYEAIPAQEVFEMSYDKFCEIAKKISSRYGLSIETSHDTDKGLYMAKFPDGTTITGNPASVKLTVIRWGSSFPTDWCTPCEIS